MTTTLKDIAKLTATSVSTVSHVLNDRPGTYIGQSTRDRVRQVARELGYRPNQMARNLRSRRSMTFGVLTAGMHFEPHVRAISAILRAAGDQGYTAALALTEEDPDRARRALDGFLAARVEGIIVAAFTFSLEAEDLLEARRVGVPVVAMDPTTEGAVAAVRIDREEGARRATSHLLDCGRRRLVHFGGPHPARYATEAARHRGFIRAHEQHGLDCSPERLVNITGGKTDEILDRVFSPNTPERPDGIVCLSDNVAFAVLSALAARGLHVPKDVAVVGFGNIRLAPHAAPPLTSLTQPGEQAGAAAVRLLCEAIDRQREGKPHPEPMEEVVLTPELIVRESCGGLSR